MQAIYAPSPSLHLQRWRWLYWTVTWVSSLAAAAFKWNILPSLLQLAILNCDTLLHSNVISCQACTSPSFCIAPLFQEQIGAHHQSCESSRFRSISFKYLPKAWFTKLLVLWYCIHPWAKKSLVDGATLVLHRDVESNHASSCIAVICTLILHTALQGIHWTVAHNIAEKIWRIALQRTVAHNIAHRKFCTQHRSENFARKCRIEWQCVVNAPLVQNLHIPLQPRICTKTLEHWRRDANK